LEVWNRIALFDSQTTFQSLVENNIWKICSSTNRL